MCLFINQYIMLTYFYLKFNIFILFTNVNHYLFTNVKCSIFTALITFSMKFSVQLQQIMSHFNLGTTELADKILVPKATISHLISERNNPSLEFITKLHTHFPSLNLEWLIYGKGPFLANEKAVIEEPFIEKRNDVFEEKIIFEEVKNEPQKDTFVPIENNLLENTEIDKNIISSPTPLNKKIEAIVIFYTDGSFKRFTDE